MALSLQPAVTWLGSPGCDRLALPLLLGWSFASKPPGALGVMPALTSGWASNWLMALWSIPAPRPLKLSPCSGSASWSQATMDFAPAARVTRAVAAARRRLSPPQCVHDAEPLHRTGGRAVVTDPTVEQYDREIKIHGHRPQATEPSGLFGSGHDAKTWPDVPANKSARLAPSVKSTDPEAPPARAATRGLSALRWRQRPIGRRPCPRLLRPSGRP